MNKKEILNEISEILLNLFPFSYDGDDTIHIDHPVYNKLKIVDHTLQLNKSFKYIFNYHIPSEINLNDPNWKSLLTQILLSY